MAVVKETLLHSLAGEQWRRIGIRHHHGINLPLFSLHSQKSSGIGEYPDLIPMIKYLHDVGFDVLQLLPLNDLGNSTSPYTAISAFALNPIHLGLHDLPYLETLPELQKRLPTLHELNKSPRVDYPAVYQAKESFLRDYINQVADKLRQLEDYQYFLATQKDWLEPFAYFKALKIKNQWSSWQTWEASELSDPAIRPQAEFHMLIQYLCFLQMKEVKSVAAAHGVLLKGDIPILIDRESADVWHNRSLFLFDRTAGAPPDMYSVEGQNWGCPIYNWEMLAQEDYLWWRRRLEVASAFYDLYRIDHIVGFFRIWAIPQGRLGHEGSFVPEDPALWIAHGRRILEVMLQAAPMLPLGEDLGQVPPEVRVCLKELGICGTKVMRWERAWHDPGQPYIGFDQYPAESLTTVSTHDSDTLQGWWQNDVENAQAFSKFMKWDYPSSLTQSQLRKLLEISHHTSSLFHINLLNEYLACIPGMHSEDPKEERINIPGLVSPINWSYRFKPSVEQLVDSIPLRELMREVLK